MHMNPRVFKAVDIKCEVKFDLLVWLLPSNGLSEELYKVQKIKYDSYQCNFASEVPITVKYQN